MPQPIASPQTAPLYPPSYYRTPSGASGASANEEPPEQNAAAVPRPPLQQSRSQTAPSIPLMINKPVPPTPEPSVDVPALSRSQSESATMASMSNSLRTGRRRPTPLMADDQSTLNRISMAVDQYSQRSDSPAQFFERRRPRPSFDELSVDTSAGSISDSASTTSSRKFSDSKDITARMNILQAQARLPWYLRPSYVEGEDILLDNDGSVKAGNVVALVERLSVDAGSTCRS